MTSNLSPSAIHRVIFLVENDDRPTNTREKKRHIRHRPIDWHTLRADVYADHMPNSKWEALYKLYMGYELAPPLDYLRSFELALVLKGEVDDVDVQAIFARRKPMEFWGCPPLLVSKIVDSFGELQQEPTFLDLVITPLFGIGAFTPSKTWPQVYATYLPCYACTTVTTVEEQRSPRLTNPTLKHAHRTLDYAVEKFHISSASFSKRLTVELYYLLEDGEEDETELHATLMLLPDFASEVFGFLDRAHIGASLVANRGLYDVICQLAKRLPVHNLICAFEKQRFHQVYVLSVGGAYWLELRHFRRDCSYINTRHFKLPSAAGAEDDSALIRRYLSNSHVADLKPPEDFPFAFKMLASLAARNTSVGRVELRADPCAEAQRLSDYRSMDTVFGVMRLSDFDLSCEEHRFFELRRPSNEEQQPRGHARSKSPLWVAGIYLLPNCAYYRVDYWSDRHLRLIERKMVQICEEFERGKITETVEHFQLKATKRTNYEFKRDNLFISGLKVEGKRDWDRINNFEWDVYRFRNASTSEHLTACVGRDFSLHSTRTVSILHIVKGEVYPDVKFATY